MVGDAWRALMKTFRVKCSHCLPTPLSSTPALAVSTPTLAPDSATITAVNVAIVAPLCPHHPPSPGLRCFFVSQHYYVRTDLCSRQALHLPKCGLPRPRAQLNPLPRRCRLQQCDCIGCDCFDCDCRRRPRVRSASAREDIARRIPHRTRRPRPRAVPSRLSTLDDVCGTRYRDTYWRGGAQRPKTPACEDASSSQEEQPGQPASFSVVKRRPDLGSWSYDAPPGDLRPSEPAIEEESPSTRPLPTSSCSPLPTRASRS